MQPTAMAPGGTLSVCDSLTLQETSRRTSFIASLVYRVDELEKGCRIFVGGNQPFMITVNEDRDKVHAEIGWIEPSDIIPAKGPLIV